MPDGYRETTVCFRGTAEMVRTAEIAGVARLEREHTRRVTAALHRLYLDAINQEEADDVAAIRASVWNDTTGFPGSGERAKASALAQVGKRYAELRRRRFTAARSRWVDARKGWPSVRFTVAVTDPSVCDFHEYIPSTAA